MGVFEVHVGVALARPPRTDEIRKYLIAADRPIEAELLACQWAATGAGVVMPVSSRVIIWADRCGEQGQSVA